MTPFFLEAGEGRRFCIHRQPEGQVKGAILFVPPFAEELNKSRRMVALQASAFAGAGYAVLSIDLLGCGDSSGDFGEARWEAWMGDLALACDWLRRRHGTPLTLWGLRFGALLGLEFARASGERFERCLLWQPMASGEACLAQFMRLRLAGERLAGEKVTTQQLRAELEESGSLEIAGYALSRDVAANMERLKLAELGLPGIPHGWFEISAQPMAPASARIVESWKQRGISCETATVPGEPFWSTQEISECPALIEETLGCLRKS